MMLGYTLEMARRHVREAESRLERQKEIVAELRAKGRPTQAAEMLAQAYGAFLEHARQQLGIAKAQENDHKGP